MGSSRTFHQKTVALLDRYEPEFASYLAGELIDLFLVPIPGARYCWNIPTTSKRRFAFIAWLARVVYGVFCDWLGRLRAQSDFEAAAWLARSFARKLPPDCENMIIAQDFLPYLWRDRVLVGKRFSVLLTRPPIAELRSRLEALAREFPHEKNLIEFHADPLLVAAENEAFAHAERVITPHQHLCQLFPNLRTLEWQKPEVIRPPDVPNPHWLLLPASLTTHHGSHVALAAAERLGLPLLVCGDNPENLAIASDLVEFVDQTEIPWHEVAAVIHPALFETWPRLHLRALALGIPVVTTAACGLEEGEGVTIVEFNDEDGLVRALERTIAREAALDRVSDSGRDSGRDSGLETERERKASNSRASGPRVQAENP